MSPLPDDPAFADAPDSCVAMTQALVTCRQLPVSAHLRTVAEKHSMLHVDVLLLLYQLSRTTAGAVLEVGPCLGGSTIALAWGTRDRTAGTPAQPVVTIEPGGQLDHPTIPSTDILTDLRRNLAKRNVDSQVQIVEGRSGKKQVVQEVRRRLAPASVSVFCVDADGQVERDLDLYGPLLRPGCYVVADDYFGPPEKSGPTRTQIDARVRAGQLLPLGVYGWGTWFGRCPGASERRETSTR